MKVNIKKIHLNGCINAKPSKSFAHRYLFASCLSDGESVVSNIDFSEDIKASINCIYAYGKDNLIDYENNKVIFKKSSHKNYNPTFDCKESGTTLRLFFPIALVKYEKTKFIGTDRLMERGISEYEKVLSTIIFNKDVHSISTIGKITSGVYNLHGNISSQYISGLMYSLPLLDGDSQINIITEVESKNYIDMTLAVLREYGILIEEQINNGQLSYLIEGNQKYIAKDALIEGDYSNAAFLDAFNYFGNSVIINGLNENSLQSDKIYKEYFKKLDQGFCDLDIGNCIDLGPILMVFASLKDGGRFINTRRLRIKESDRGEAIAVELRKCGCDIRVLDNEIIVDKINLITPNESFDSHNDHRIAMALSLLSTQFDIEINNAECVSKSYPGYFDDIKTLGAVVN